MAFHAPYSRLKLSSLLRQLLTQQGNKPATSGMCSSGLRPGGPVMMLTKAANAFSSSAHHEHVSLVSQKVPSATAT